MILVSAPAPVFVDSTGRRRKVLRRLVLRVRRFLHGLRRPGQRQPGRRPGQPQRRHPLSDLIDDGDDGRRSPPARDRRRAPGPGRSRQRAALSRGGPPAPHDRHHGQRRTRPRHQGGPPGAPVHPKGPVNRRPPRRRPTRRRSTRRPSPTDPARRHSESPTSPPARSAATARAAARAAEVRHRAGRRGGGAVGRPSYDGGGPGSQLGAATGAADPAGGAGWRAGHPAGGRRPGRHTGTAGGRRGDGVTGAPMPRGDPHPGRRRLLPRPRVCWPPDRCRVRQRAGGAGVHQRRVPRRPRRLRGRRPGGVPTASRRRPDHQHHRRTDQLEPAAGAHDRPDLRRRARPELDAEDPGGA